MQLTTNGLILKILKIQENRRLTILTDRFGLIEAWANRTNQARSSLAAPTELLCYSQLILFKGRGRYTVDKADSSCIFFGIRSDLDKLALASYWAELTTELAPSEEEAGTYLRLLLNALHFLEKETRNATQLKAIYELRVLTLAGYMPDLVGCHICGVYEANPMFFFAQHGHLCCADCLSDSMENAAAVPPGVLAAMRHIVYSDTDKLFSFSLSDLGLALLAQICEAYAIYHLDKHLPTLAFYHSITGI